MDSLPQTPLDVVQQCSPAVFLFRQPHNFSVGDCVAFRGLPDIGSSLPVHLSGEPVEHGTKFLAVGHDFEPGEIVVFEGVQDDAALGRAAGHVVQAVEGNAFTLGHIVQPAAELARARAGRRLLRPEGHRVQKCTDRSITLAWNNADGRLGKCPGASAVLVDPATRFAIGMRSLYVVDTPLIHLLGRSAVSAVVDDAEVKKVKTAFRKYTEQLGALSRLPGMYVLDSIYRHAKRAKRLELWQPVLDAVAPRLATAALQAGSRDWPLVRQLLQKWVSKQWADTKGTYKYLIGKCERAESRAAERKAKREARQREEWRPTRKPRAPGSANRSNFSAEADEADPLLAPPGRARSHTGEAVRASGWDSGDEADESLKPRTLPPVAQHTSMPPPSLPPQPPPDVVAPVASVEVPVVPVPPVLPAVVDAAVAASTAGHKQAAPSENSSSGSESDSESESDDTPAEKPETQDSTRAAAVDDGESAVNPGAVANEQPNQAVSQAVASQPRLESVGNRSPSVSDGGESVKGDLDSDEESDSSDQLEHEGLPAPQGPRPVSPTRDSVQSDARSRASSAPRPCAAPQHHPLPPFSDAGSRDSQAAAPSDARSLYSAPPSENPPHCLPPPDGETGPQGDDSLSVEPGNSRSVRSGDGAPGVASQASRDASVAPQPALDLGTEPRNDGASCDAASAGALGSRSGSEESRTVDPRYSRARRVSSARDVSRDVSRSRSREAMRRIRSSLDSSRVDAVGQDLEEQHVKEEPQHEAAEPGTASPDQPQVPSQLSEGQRHRRPPSPPRSPPRSPPSLPRSPPLPSSPRPAAPEQRSHDDRPCPVVACTQEEGDNEQSEHRLQPPRAEPHVPSAAGEPASEHLQAHEHAEQPQQPALREHVQAPPVSPEPPGSQEESEQPLRPAQHLNKSDERSVVVGKPEEAQTIEEAVPPKDDQAPEEVGVAHQSSDDGGNDKETHEDADEMNRESVVVRTGGAAVSAALEAAGPTETPGQDEERRLLQMIDGKHVRRRMATRMLSENPAASLSDGEQSGDDASVQEIPDSSFRARVRVSNSQRPKVSGIQAFLEQPEDLGATSEEGEDWAPGADQQHADQPHPLRKGDFVRVAGSRALAEYGKIGRVFGVDSDGDPKVMLEDGSLKTLFAHKVVLLRDPGPDLRARIVGVRRARKMAKLLGKDGANPSNHVRPGPWRPSLTAAPVALPPAPKRRKIANRPAVAASDCRQPQAGDWIRVRGSRKAPEYGKVGLVLELDEDGDPNVRFDDGKVKRLFANKVTVFQSTAQAASSATPGGRKLQVGDWVRVRGKRTAAEFGKVAEVLELDEDGDPVVRFEDGSKKTLFASKVERIDGPHDQRPRVKELETPVGSARRGRSKSRHSTDSEEQWMAGGCSPISEPGVPPSKRMIRAAQTRQSARSRSRVVARLRRR